MCQAFAHVFGVSYIVQTSLWCCIVFVFVGFVLQCLSKRCVSDVVAESLTCVLCMMCLYSGVICNPAVVFFRVLGLLSAAMVVARVVGTARLAHRRCY